MLSAEWSILDRRRIAIRRPPRGRPLAPLRAGFDLIALAAAASSRISVPTLSAPFNPWGHRRPHHGQDQNRTNIDTQATAPKPERIMTKGMRSGGAPPAIWYPSPTRPPTKKNMKIFNAVLDVIALYCVQVPIAHRLQSLNTLRGLRLLRSGANRLTSRFYCH
jgi:hypothetical protein